jgi:Methyltransferase domain
VAPVTSEMDYALKGRNRVAGWFSRIDAEIFRLITHNQSERSLTGSMVEIGLHHGKSFIALCLALKDTEKAYGVDLFENQALNRDHSGRGSRTHVEANLASFGIDPSRVVLDARSSEEVTALEIIEAAGKARFFSIDGGHWLDIVVNDLLLAEAALMKYGVIALDDFHNPEWPEVSAGYFSWWAKRSSAIVPFAIGFNKLYLCLEEYADLYRGILQESVFLTPFLVKEYLFQGQLIPVYRPWVRADVSFTRRAVLYLKVVHPDVYFGLRRIWRKLGRRGR